MSSFPTWAHLSIMAAAVLLCPVLAFLMAIGVEILIGVLRDAGCSPISEPRPLPDGTIIEPGRTISQLAQMLHFEDAAKARDGVKYILMRGHIQYRDIFPDTPMHHD